MSGAPGFPALGLGLAAGAGQHFDALLLIPQLLFEHLLYTGSRGQATSNVSALVLVRTRLRALRQTW